jgi:hypothetical protein
MAMGGWMVGMRMSIRQINERERPFLYREVESLSLEDELKGREVNHEHLAEDRPTHSIRVYRHTDTQTHRHTDRRMDRHTDIHTVK